MPTSRIPQTSYSVPRALAPIDLWLDANESPSIFNAIPELSLKSLNRYPSREALETAIATRLGVAKAQVIVTNGGDDGIDRICRAYVGPGKNLVMTSPGFEMIATYARISGGDVQTVPWVDGDFPSQAVLDIADDHTNVIAIVSPNNPTGSTARLADIQQIAKARPATLILLDLAYVEFADEDPQHAVLSLSNVVTIRTFSKAWGLAGLRLGYAVGSPDIIGTLRAAGGPYPASTLSLQVAEEALKHENAMLLNVERTRLERQELSQILNALGASTIDSQANFVMARVPVKTDEAGAWLRDALSGFGIGIRAWPNRSQPYDLRPYVRITCPADIPGFLRLRQALECSIKPEAMLFDLDGVLADVSGSYRAAIIEAAAYFGAHIDDEDIQVIKKRGNANNDWVVTHTLLRERGIDVSFEEVKDQFERRYQGTHGFDGLWKTETLLASKEWLQGIRSRYKIAIVTGRPRSDAERFIQHFGLENIFETMVCMEDAPLKPSPEPLLMAMRTLGVHRAWMFGDTPDDMHAARSASCLPVGVLAPGHQDTETLFSAGAAWVHSRITDVFIP
jgi:histidinol-phosphate aminotransferase